MFNKNRKQLTELIRLAEKTQLASVVISDARAYNNAGEYKLCLELFVDQVDEFDIYIDANFYALLTKIAINLGMEREEYSSLERLVNK